GKLPLLAAGALVLSARLSPVVSQAAPMVRETVAAPRAHEVDLELIESVLARRAPEFGLTLRKQVARAVVEEARRAGYDPLLILAVIDVESDFSTGAVSDKGARGLMQIQPTTLHFLAQREGLKLSQSEVAADPSLTVRLGIRYLRQLHDRFHDLDLALMAYNAGPTKLRRFMRENEHGMFRAYSQAVRRDYWRFRRREGLGGDWALAQREAEGAEGTAAPAASR
ncbi:MAG: lytic transglycosylase domain-containing protein, partial [Myxococcaceae bacterium]